MADNNKFKVKEDNQIKNEKNIVIENEKLNGINIRAEELTEEADSYKIVVEIK